MILNALLNVKPGTLCKGMALAGIKDSPLTGRFSERTVHLDLSGWKKAKGLGSYEKIVFFLLPDDISDTFNLSVFSSGESPVHSPENTKLRDALEDVGMTDWATATYGDPVGMLLGRHAVCDGLILTQLLTADTLGWMVLRESPNSRFLEVLP